VAQVVVPPRLVALLSSWHADTGDVTNAAEDLVARYCEAHRRYHTLEHIDEVLAVTDSLDAADEVTAAVWFHDVIYDPRAADNETRSATYAQQLLGSLGAPTSFTTEVARLVESTALHDPAPTDRNGVVLADADLSILGAPPGRYERYARDVRDEYRHVSADDWRRGRAAVVRSFLEREQLFHSPSMRDELEPQALENLRRELVALSAP
jgi:predicted metal-dependent HD superfamily phosphohydrolase